MKGIFKIGLMAGLLITVLVFLGGCFPSTATEPAEDQGWFAKYGMIIFLVLIFAMFYFITIRPQRKKMKEQQTMIAGLQKGNRVITAGGIFGTIDAVREDSFIIKVESGTLLRVAKGSVMLLKEPEQK